MDNRSLSHTRWKCQYHIVFIPKYRKRILYGRLREDVKEIISTLCKYRKVDIIAGAVCKDHVHLSVAIPPKESISDFMGYLKGKSTLMIYDRHPEHAKQMGQSFLGERILCRDNRQYNRGSRTEIHKRASRRLKKRGFQ